MNKNKSATGFTIIELIVAISIIIVLSGIGFGGYSKYISSANRGKELHAGRALMAGFHAFSADNGGKIIKAMDDNTSNVVDKQGRPVMSHAAKRWPWRLAPYIDYNTDILMVNNKEAAPEKDKMFSYLVSVFPTFGMNGIFVGGKYGTSFAPDNPRSKRFSGCVVNITQPVDPSKLIVFVTSKIKGAPHRGCFDVSFPGIGAVGEVDYLYDNKAVVAYFDGHIELNTPDQLSDICLWSNQAAIDKSFNQ